MTAVSLTASLTVDGNAIAFTMSYAADYLRVFDFELAAGDVMALTFDSTTEGADIEFLFIKALNNADTSQHTTVKYGFSDSDAASPAAGTAWRTINGIHLARETAALSTLNKLYVYNSGANRANIKAIVGLDGA